jgi:hypothetical protein
MRLIRDPLFWIVILMWVVYLDAQRFALDKAIG